MNKLEHIRVYETENRKKISGEERPAFHLTAAVGWLNDPNGFSWYNGKYHLYYQYNPYSVRWGEMNWGHWTSENLVDWQFEPAVFAPDEDYETGVFSGSAIPDLDGSLLVMYTAHFETEPERGRVYRRETQCIARGDGYSFQKDPANPVIKEEDLPDFAEIGDFRDPKIWYDHGMYHAILVTRNHRTQLGVTLLYESGDALHWNYITALNENDGRFGRMWECPDMYHLNGKDVITVSAMQMKTDDPHYRNGHVTLAFVGEYDRENHQFQSPDPQAVDLGFDYYAPQSMVTPDGRRISVGWMQAPESGTCAPENAKWYGMISFPRELSVRDGRLYQNPVQEIQKLYLDTVRVKDLRADVWKMAEEISGRVIDLSVTVEPDEKNGQMWDNFSMKFADDGIHFVQLTYRKSDGHLILDRRHAGRSSEICDVREVLVGISDQLKLRLLLDRYSFEIFVNDGAEVLSGTLYEMPLEADGISFEAKGAILDIEKHALREAALQTAVC